jgi:hypothetical protein
MWWSDYGTMPWMFFFGPIAMILFLVICLALLFFTMRGEPRGGADAIEFLKRRFALRNFPTGAV